MSMRLRSLPKAGLVVVLLAASTLPIVPHAEETRCAAPTIEVTPMPGGQRQLKIQSPCRKGELVIGRYGEIVIMDKLDPGGSLAFHLDCFLGDREVDLTFVDDSRTTNHACATADSTLTKVAIVWRDPVDLDLHAFEYAAMPGSAYDRSAHNPGSLQAAESEYVRANRSHGFMSTVSDGRQLGHNVEVYTLPHHPAEPRGVIAMAVSLGANGVADAESCGARREPLRVDLDVYVLDPGMKLRHYERTFAAQPCDGASPRFVSTLVPNILLGSTGRTANAP
jgi:hypothetical protein